MSAVTFRILLVLSLLLAGCRSLPKRLAEAEAELAERTLTESARIRDIPARPLPWDEAVSLLREHNLALREARDNVIRAEESYRRIYLDLLPAVSISANLSRALTDLGNISSDDLNLNTFAIVSIPGIVNLRTRHYTASLERLRAAWSLELREREQIADLYRTFVRAETLRLRKGNLEQSQLWNATLSQQSLQADPEVLSREAQLFSIGQEEDLLQDKLAELLGSYDYRWQPDAATLPTLGYLDDPLPVDDIDRTGVLLRRMQAAEVEGARLRELGVKLQYWPDLTFALSSPPLFQVSGGETTGWDPDLVMFNAGSSLRLDTQLRVAQQLRDVRRSIALMHDRLKLEITRNVQRHLAALESLALCERELQLVELRLAVLEEAPRSLNVDTWRDQLQRLILLSERRASLLQQKASLETYFWVLDESRWSAPSET